MVPRGVSEAAEIDPRIERSRRLVLEATVHELSEKGYGGLTVEGVAARSGVAKSTIYRHWSGRLELVEAAMRVLKPSLDLPAGGTVRDRVKVLLVAVASAVRSSEWSACLPALIDAAERDPDVCELHRRTSCDRRKLLVGLIEEAVAAGELPPDTDALLASEALVGPIFMRRLFVREPFGEADAEKLVSMIFGPDVGRS